MEVIKLIYHIHAPPDEGMRQAEHILLEQTVETPEAVARAYPHVVARAMGRLVEAGPHPSGAGVRAVLEAPAPAPDAALLMNTLWGNVSLLEHVRLEGFEIGAGLAQSFGGPRHGIGGLRRATGAAGRALTLSALKPVGLGAPELAALAGKLAGAGIDMVKDDHYLADQPWAPLAARVAACQAAVAEANARRAGGRTLYAPHLVGPPEALRRACDLAQQAGAEAVLLSPMLIGLPVFQELVARRLSVPALAHPSFAGAGRLPEPLLLGRIFRLLGADAVIFANYGGRFSHTRAHCLEVAARLREPWHDLAPALPTPAGGMHPDRVPELYDAFGPDTGLLVGGALLEADDLSAAARSFVQRVSEGAPAARAAERPAALHPETL